MKVAGVYNLFGLILSTVNDEKNLNECLNEDLGRLGGVLEVFRKILNFFGVAENFSREKIILNGRFCVCKQVFV